MHVELPENERENLGNAGRVSFLGGISILFSLFSFVLYFIGIFISLASGLAGLIFYAHDMGCYRADPGKFTLSSYKRLIIGRRMAIAGFILNGIWMIVIAINYGKDGLN